MIYLFLASLSIIFSAVESISYVGYVVSHFGIHPLFIYILSILLSPFAVKLPKSLARPLYVITLCILIGFTTLIFAENFMYPNFIYSHLHINPYTITPFIVLLIFHVSALTQIGILKSVLFAGLIYLATSGAGKTLAMIASNFNMISRAPFASYSDKMTGAYPGFYPAMQTIKSITPEDSTILIPPQGNPWEIEGNAAMVTYFLYPRKVKNLDPQLISQLAENTYLLISKGSWERNGAVDYGWPKISVPARQLWEITDSGQILGNYKRDYDPSKDTWVWGLIEVKHE